jgi:hypothetical protein
MIKQSIACENTKMQCWMFKKGIYECMMCILWEFVRMIHGSGNYVVTRMCTMSQDCSGTSLSMILMCLEVDPTSEYVRSIHKESNMSIR